MTEGIGCYPPTWPRPPKPPVPEPVPSSLDEQVDWMTYSHPELYEMVHSGLDLTGAMSVSAKWARLGDELSDIADELSRLLAATAQAWEGESAELAKESVKSLSDWSRDSGTRATGVSGCITIQVDNATTARNSMPKPPYPVGHPNDPPTDAIPLDTAFVSGDFGDAAPLVADPEQYSSRERALHQQAAATMQTFQDNTRDVYATVPQFAPPSLRRELYSGPVEQPPTPQPTPSPQPQPLPPVPPVSRGPVGGGSPPPTVGGGQPGGTPATRTPAPLGTGAGTGTAEPAAGRPAPAAAAAPGRAAGQGMGGGGVPMGHGAGGQDGDDKERKGKKYLEGDDDIWGLEDEKVMPPVIGEVNRRA
jgi:hypothetical protein